MNSEEFHFHETANDELLEMIPQEELDRVLNQHECDIEPSFLGFVGIYRNLSEMIPKHWTVIDFGCAYNAQAYFFRDHKRCIAVDTPGITERFMTPNCEFHEMRAQRFIVDLVGGDSDIDLETTFAICSYVPDEGAQCAVKNWFPNCYVFYPSGGKK